MSDRDTLRLKRALADDPRDAVALETLAAARTRAGRGWADEALPRDLRCSPKERGDDVGFRVALSEPEQHTEDPGARFASAMSEPLRRPEPPPVTELLDPVMLVEQRGRSTPSVWRRGRRGPPA